MPDLPPLDALRVFDAAARAGSFQGAAETLNITPSAVSHRIRALEALLGTPLFRRVGRQVSLTPAGARYAEAVGEAIAQLRAATRRLAAGSTRTLNLSLAPAFAMRWLLPRLARFQRAHPEVEVRFVSNTALVDFQRDDVDLAVRYGRGDWPGVCAEWLMALDTLPVCAPALIDGDPPLARPADLARHTLLHCETRPDDWRMWFVAAGVAGIDPTAGAHFESMPVALEAAAQGLGIAIADRQIIGDDLAGGRLVAPFDIYTPAAGAYYLVYPEEPGLGENGGAFREWLLEEMATAQAGQPEGAAGPGPA
jgi:LysR family glycine cleavage system transcriptional activator